MGEGLSSHGTRIRTVFACCDAAVTCRSKCQSRCVGVWYVLPVLRISRILNVLDEDESAEDKDGWETISMDGHQIGIKTSAIEEKCQAFETLVIYCSTLGARFAPYLSQSLELVLPSLRFILHEGVREACALYEILIFCSILSRPNLLHRLVPMLLAAGKESGTLTHQMVNASFTQIINCITLETDISFLASLYKAVSDSLRVIGGVSSLPQEIRDSAIEATKRQLQSIADRRKVRANLPAAEIQEDKEEISLLEEMEDFALEDMAKMLQAFESNHPLLVAVSSVRELGLHLGNWDSSEEGGNEG